jgi:hypothetical protein
MNPLSYAHLIFHKGTKKHMMERKQISSSTNVAGKSSYLLAKKLKLDPCLSPCSSINSTRIKHLNIRPETLKLYKKRAGNSLEAIDIRQGLPQQNPSSSATKRNDGQLGLNKIKKLLHNKRNGI